MRDSLNFFWVGKMPDMDGLFAWQKHLKEKGSEFNTRLWVDDGLFNRLLAGEGASSFESVRQINSNELEVVRNGQTLVISNFDRILLEPARRDYPKCCEAYDSLKENGLYAWSSDFARLLILNHGAGIYSDYDIEPNPDKPFPKSLASLSREAGHTTDGNAIDDFVSRRDTQVILAFNNTGCEKLLQKHERNIDLVSVEKDIRERKEKERISKGKVQRTYGDTSSKEYEKFQWVVSSAKAMFRGEDLSYTFRKHPLAARDPYVTERLDESAQFVYNHDVAEYSQRHQGNIQPEAKRVIETQMSGIFLNPIQDRVPLIYGWQNPQLMQILNRWHEAHKVVASILKEIERNFPNPDTELQIIIDALKEFAFDFKDDALTRIKDKVFDGPLRDILLSRNLLTDENKIKLEAFTGEFPVTGSVSQEAAAATAQPASTSAPVVAQPVQQVRAQEPAVSTVTKPPPPLAAKMRESKIVHIKNSDGSMSQLTLDQIKMGEKFLGVQLNEGVLSQFIFENKNGALLRYPIVNNNGAIVCEPPHQHTSVYKNESFVMEWRPPTSAQNVPTDVSLDMCFSADQMQAIQTAVTHSQQIKSSINLRDGTKENLSDNLIFNDGDAIAINTITDKKSKDYLVLIIDYLASQKVLNRATFDLIVGVAGKSPSHIANLYQGLVFFQLDVTGGQLLTEEAITHLAQFVRNQPGTELSNPPETSTLSRSDNASPDPSLGAAAIGLFITQKKNDSDFQITDAVLTLIQGKFEGRGDLVNIINILSRQEVLNRSTFDTFITIPTDKLRLHNFSEALATLEKEKVKITPGMVITLSQAPSPEMTAKDFVFMSTVNNAAKSDLLNSKDLQLINRIPESKREAILQTILLLLKHNVLDRDTFDKIASIKDATSIYNFSSALYSLMDGGVTITKAIVSEFSNYPNPEDKVKDRLSDILEQQRATAAQLTSPQATTPAFVHPESPAQLPAETTPPQQPDCAQRTKEPETTLRPPPQQLGQIPATGGATPPAHSAITTEPASVVDQPATELQRPEFRGVKDSDEYKKYRRTELKNWYKKEAEYWEDTGFTDNRITKLNSLFIAAKNDKDLKTEVGKFGKGPFSKSGNTDTYQAVIANIKYQITQILSCVDSKTNDDKKRQFKPENIKQMRKILNEEVGRGPHFFNSIMGGTTSYRKEKESLDELEKIVKAESTQAPRK